MHLPGQERVARGRLPAQSALLLVLLGAWVLAPACSCDGGNNNPDVGVPVDMGDGGDTDAGDAGDDAGDSGGDAGDAGDDAGDVPEDGGDDTGDVPVDMDMADVDVEDEMDMQVPDDLDPDLPISPFEASCLYPVVNCLGASPEPLSCSIGAISEETVVSYGEGAGGGLAARWRRGEDGAVFFESFVAGESCYTALGTDGALMPAGWEIGTRGGDAQYSTRREGDNIIVTCADGSEESWESEVAAPWLPQILSEDDALCARLGAPRCGDDPSCQQFNPQLECCEVVGSARCLRPAACPQVGDEPPELDSCLTPLLECFGRRHVQLSCEIDGNQGQTQASYDRGRRMVVTDDGFGNLAVETAGAEGLCFTARMSGERPWGEITFDDANGDDLFRVTFDGDQAQVTCADATSEQQSAAAILEYLPAFPTEDDGCDVVPLNDCSPDTQDADCNGGLCCETLQGNRCLAVEACPEVPGGLRESCVYPVLECFGRNPALQVCSLYEELNISQVAYTNGARATFYEELGRQARLTYNDQSPCFEAVALPEGEGYQVRDQVNDSMYELRVRDGELLVACPDGQVEAPYPASEVALMRGYFPAPPSNAECEPPQVDNACDGDSDCEEGGVCCNIGDRRICAPAEACEDLQPREVCDPNGDVTCADGLTCCALDYARVCNPSICGQDQICCDVPQGAAVCATQDRCDTFDACSLGEQDACPEGGLCCPTEQGTRCLDVDACPVEDAWETSCLFGTFDCFGADNDEVLACTFNDDAQVLEASYASGASVLFFDSRGSQGRRVVAADQECFVALEGQEGLEVMDLVTQERFQVTLNGDTARITCPVLEGEQEARVQEVPALELTPYLPAPPAQSFCEPANNDLCADDASCADQGEGFVCCNTGAARECLPLDTCEALTPRTSCDDASQCGQGETCCELELVQVCDPLVCGDELCCLQPSANVCATEEECNAFDECDPFNLNSCDGENELCCDGLGGARCVADVDVCPDGTVENSCLGALMGCFGADQQVNSCQLYESAGVKVVGYEEGVEASYYRHLGRPTRRTRNGDLPCFEASQRAGGYVIQDLVLGDSYEVTIEGEEAEIVCPGEVRQTVRASSLLSYLPAAPADSACAPTLVEAQCDDDVDCAVEGELCCDLGDRRVCATEAICAASQPQPACESNGQCSGDTVCCAQPSVRVCDPSICPEGQVCCDVGTRDVCADQEVCDEPADLCDLQNQEGCGDGELCCDTNAGARCVSADEGCPDLWEQSCLRPVVECQGTELEQDSCVARTETQLEVQYSGGARISWDVGADPLRFTSYGPDTSSPCFSAQVTPEGYALSVLGDGSYDVRFVGDRAFVTCSDGSSQRAPRAQVDPYFVGSPVRDQCQSPEDAWRASCLYSVFACLGEDLQQESCVDYQQVNRVEVSYDDARRAIFSARGDRQVVQTFHADSPCFQALELEEADGYEISDLVGEATYTVTFQGDVAQVVCPDSSRDVVEATFVRDILPVRPNDGSCQPAPRDDACQEDSDCAGVPGTICCDTGLENACLSAEGCFNNTPQVLCDQDDQCGQGEFCCEREAVRVCDLELCGDEICCEVTEQSACGTEDACNGVFNACPVVDEPIGCQDGALCCDTVEGNRCIEGDACPEPPNPLEGSCAFNTLECFGRSGDLAACVAWPPEVDRVEAMYDSGGAATFFNHRGDATMRAYRDPIRCFDAVETVNGFMVLDLQSGDSFEVAFDGPDAIVTCGEVSEMHARSTLSSYFPARPEAETCRPAMREDACQEDSECEQGSVCCDLGDGNVCTVADQCERLQPHETCSQESQCGDGQECCPLGAVRVCDPVLCGDQEVCCNVIQAQVCAENAECNNYEDVCAVDDNNTCPQGSTCCPTNNGTRCYELGQGEQCPVQEDPWQTSCLFPVLDCGGDELELDRCVALGEGALLANYANGATHSFQSVDGAQARDVRRGDQSCYRAVQSQEGEGGYEVAAQGANYNVSFQGANARVECPDGTISNVPRATVEAYLPAPPVVEQCEDAQAAWRSSCLYGVFSCFGTNNALSSCEDHIGLDFTQANYNTGNSAVFGASQGEPLVRTSGVLQPCFRAQGTLGGGLEVEDLVTGERFVAQTNEDGLTVDIACPGDVRVDTVRLGDVEAYLPERPVGNQCTAVQPEQLCTVDLDCNQGETCCNLGSRTECLPRESCERNRPRPSCDEDAQCGQDQQCCPLGPMVICDADICGDEPCCSVEEATVCATAQECNGIFDACDVDNNGSCALGSTCCETFEGTRCLEGNSCPPPPDPLAGTCLFDIFQCFGRFLEEDQCVDWGDLDLTDVSYTGNRRAVFYNHEGLAASRMGLQDFFCYEALGDGGQVALRDLFSDDMYQVTFANGVAEVTCPDNSSFEVAQGAVEAYLPQRPESGCAVGSPTVECAGDQECGEGAVCCDRGDIVTCTAEDACEQLQVRPTCGQDSDCGQGETCCSLVGTRICDPSVCGDELCCDRGGQAVCGSSQACTEIEDACIVGDAQSCAPGELCCDTNSGTRCLPGAQACEPVEDLWPTSCLFEAFSCFGANQAIDACFDFGNGGPTEATYLSGARARFSVNDMGREVILAGRGLETCFTATEIDDMGTGFAVTDGDALTYEVHYIGDQAQITCPDQTRVNVDRGTVEGYLPPRPQPLECVTAEQQWQASCLFGTFDCFGSNKELDQCLDHGDLGLQTASYSDGASATWFGRGDLPVLRTESDLIPCFEYAATNVERVFEVRDLSTEEMFTLTYDGDAVQITCPDAEVQTVTLGSVAPYLPPAPEGCDPAPRNDQCQVDADCGDAQLICCDLGDGNQCRTRRECAQLVPRTSCVEDAQCGDGDVCCELGPVRVCDPALCNGELCCELEEASVCGDDRTCGGFIDECQVGNDSSCASGSVCCQTVTGNSCLVGDACPEPPNAVLETCLGETVDCFGAREYESCSIWEGLDRIEASYTFDGRVIHFARNGLAAFQAISNQVSCYQAVETVEGGYSFTNLRTEEAFAVTFEGDQAMIACPDTSTEVVPRADLERWLLAAPQGDTCQAAPREDACQANPDCNDPQLVCCDFGDRNVCVTAEDCFYAQPRPSCDVDEQCGVGETCCQFGVQRSCDPEVCGAQEVCCDVPEEEDVAVCGTANTCAGVFDACPTVGQIGGCADGSLCCDGLMGNRCVVGQECPALPDPIEDTCLSAAFGCFGADREVVSCEDWGDRLDRTEALFGDSREATFYSYLNRAAIRTNNGVAGCYEAVETEAGYAVTDLVFGGVNQITVVDQTAQIACGNGDMQEVPLAAVLRYLPPRPVAQSCDPAQVVDGCQTNAECQINGMDMVCCDAGEARECLPRDSCAQLTPTQVCQSDTDCEMGTVCCELDPVRVCEPTSCGDDQVCCELGATQVCATQARCEGRLDLCSMEEADSCPDGFLCCPSLNGLDCVEGDSCPVEQDPVAQSCIGGVLGCVARDAEQVSCQDWGELDYTRSLFDDNSQVIFFSRYQASTWAAVTGDVICYEAVETGEGTYQVRSLQGEAPVTYGLTIANGQAMIDCPDGEQDVTVTEAELRAWLPRRPDPQTCADGRQDACQDNGDCNRPGEICCDTGEGNVCLRGDECAQQSPREVCGGGDELPPVEGQEECAMGTMCCALPLEQVQVCDPLVCGAQEVCCLVPSRAVCATDAECNGVIDTCVVGDADTCPNNSTCCETLQGAVCLEVNECPDAPDPIVGTCLEQSFACFGRFAQQTSCVDWSPRLERVEASYENLSSAVFFDRAGETVVWTQAGIQGCFEAMAAPEGEGLIIVDNVDPEGVVHTVAYSGDQAMITCADERTFTVPRAAINAYVPSIPTQGCDAAAPQDECANDGQCGRAEVCCDLGSQQACLPAEACFLTQNRASCDEVADCGDGELCCARELVRVCDPALCPLGEVCCTVDNQDEALQVCGSEDTCNGTADLCSTQDAQSCLEGEVCCPTQDGLRCQLGNECQPLPEPVLDTCLGTALSCFGQEPAQAACVDWSQLGLVEASFEQGAVARFFTDAQGRQAVRTHTAELPCYLATTLEDGYEIQDLLGEAGTVQVQFAGNDVQITCDQEVLTVRRSSLEKFLPVRPAPESCDAPVRPDECGDNGDCQALDPALQCCDAGDANVCGFSDTCFFQQPRTLCQDDSVCGVGETCCGFETARVCDPSICGDELCCDAPSVQVCGTADECLGIYDFCDVNDDQACAQGALCCDTLGGARCLEVNECPGVVNPIEATCLAGVLTCFGADNTYNECSSYEAAGVVRAEYTGEDNTGRSVQFFQRNGLEARRAYNTTFPCFDAVEREDGGFTITDTITQEVFEISVVGQGATITCADNSTEAVPAGALRAYLPVAPEANSCGVPDDLFQDCNVDNDCVAMFGPEFVCCGTGQGNICDLREFCGQLEPQEMCTQDSQCGEGVGCCTREVATICDPSLCNGQVCCTLENVQTCGGSPGACQVSESCLGDTLSCFGEMPALDACVDYGELGVVSASYEGGGEALFYTDRPSGGLARRTTFDFAPCFQAVEVDGGYQILNLQTNEAYVVGVQGEDAVVTCADNSTETVPAAAVMEFLPVQPDVNQCGAPVRNDECQANSDCVGIFGVQAVCCDNGLGNQCEPDADSCNRVQPAQTCNVNADCPEGTGCCPQEQRRVCDPTFCGDDICCIPQDPAPVCDALCLFCQDNSDCQDGDVCCPFTGTCTDRAECEPEPACATDNDCEQGLVCCTAGQYPICTVAEQCAEPCSVDADCGQGRVCCGDQSDPYGAYCTTSNQCRDEGNEACSGDSDCGNGQVCCRSGGVAACVDAGACPEVCATDLDCGNGEECCLGNGRTPLCVPNGTCLKSLGESCAQDSECGEGLTCCGYDVLGDVCVPSDQCDQQVPRTACAQDPTICGGFTLATCCTVDGEAVCAPRLACDQAWDVCAQDSDCGASGFMCCNELVDSYCVGWTVNSCGDGNPF